MTAYTTISTTTSILMTFFRANVGKTVVKLVHYLHLFCGEPLGTTGTGIFYRCPSRQPADSIKALKDTRSIDLSQ